jgi:hypothetical protein
MRQGLSYFEVRPAALKPTDRSGFGNVEGVLIRLVDLGQGFDQIRSVAFVSAQGGADGMRVDWDVQDRLIFHFSSFIFHFDIAAGMADEKCQMTNGKCSGRQLSLEDDSLAAVLDFPEAAAASV